MCVQDADLWDLMAPRRGIPSWNSHFRHRELSLSQGQRDTAEGTPGQRPEGTNTATEPLADAKGEMSSEALFIHAPNSLLVMGRETLLLTRNHREAVKKKPGQALSQCKPSLLQLDRSQHFTH